MSILHAINVDHWEDEKEVIFLDLIKFSVGHKIIDDTFQNKRTLGLSRMLTGHKDNAFELIGLL